jgi:hypothetical protein
MTTPTTWPTTLPKPSIDAVAEEVYKPAIKTEFEANYIQNRVVVSRTRRKFPLTWNYMTEANYQTLKTFFESYQGTVFVFTHPVEGTTHNCVFSESSLKSKWYSKGWRSAVECPIEEV